MTLDRVKLLLANNTEWYEVYGSRSIQDSNVPGKMCMKLKTQSN
jgi:hypothetical protein